MLADQHYAAVMVFHRLVDIDIGNLIAGPEFHQLATDAVAGGDVHTAVVKNGRGNDSGLPRKRRLPKYFAVIGRDTDHVLRRALNVLPRAVLLPDDGGRLVGRICKLL